MTQQQKKILHALLNALNDENYVSKLSRYRTLSFLGGWACFYISILESFQPNIPLWAISLTGLLAGLLIGAGFFFTLAIRQWPVVKAIVDPEKARKLMNQR